MIEERSYRLLFPPELEQHLLVVGETDLAICLPKNIWNATVEKGLRDEIIAQRQYLQDFIVAQPEFAASHQPLMVPLSAPPVAQKMAAAARAAGVGPMAAVAGYFAQLTGRYLCQLNGCTDIIVENGGDIFIASREERIIGVYAGEANPFSGKIAVRLAPELFPCGVCTSSGTIGSSFSYGVADAAMIVAPDAALADAVATAAANLVKDGDCVAAACNYAMSIPTVAAALIICGDQMAAAGQLELLQI